MAKRKLPSPYTPDILPPVQNPSSRITLIAQDISGSQGIRMAGKERIVPRIEAGNEGCRRFLCQRRSIAPNDYACIFRYNHTIYPPSPAHELKSGLHDLFAILGDSQVNGNTDIPQAINTLSNLAGYFLEVGFQKVEALLLTDGHGGKSHDVIQAAATLKQHVSSFTVFGIADTPNEVKEQDLILAASPGHYFFCRTMDQLFKVTEGLALLLPAQLPASVQE